MHAEQAGTLRRRVPPAPHRLPDFLLLPCGPFANHGPFELSEGSDHLHHHPARRCSGVDGLGEAAEACPGDLDLLHQVQEVFEAAAEPIQLPDDDHVSLAELVEHLMQLGTIPAATGGVFGEHARDPGVFERAELRGGVLVLGFADTGVTDVHRASWGCFTLLPLSVTVQHGFATQGSRFAQGITKVAETNVFATLAYSQGQSVS